MRDTIAQMEALGVKVSVRLATQSELKAHLKSRGLDVDASTDGGDEGSSDIKIDHYEEVSGTPLNLYIVERISNRATITTYGAVVLQDPSDPATTFWCRGSNCQEVVTSEAGIPKSWRYLAAKLWKLLRFRKGAQQAARTIDPKKLDHIFGNPRHKLGPLVQRFGSQEATFTAVESATQVAVKSQGLRGVFETTVTVAGQSVVVRGKVISGFARIGTFFIP